MNLHENKSHILIVDDDERIRKLLSRFLREQGYIVSTAEHPAQAREVLDWGRYDLMVVDVMMPGQNGFDFSKDVRQTSDIPFIFLTAKIEMEDKVKGFSSGGDDYITKPFEPQELVLRIEAILKRRKKEATDKNRIFVGRWVYSPMIAELKDAGNMTQRLTEVENKLLTIFVENRGQVVSRQDISNVFDEDKSDRTIDVQITRLRKKIEEDPKYPRLLQTVRGKGYILHA